MVSRLDRSPFTWLQWGQWSIWCWKQGKGLDGLGGQKLENNTRQKYLWLKMVGLVGLSAFLSQENNPHSNWIPKTIIFSNSLPFWYCVTVSKGELHYNQRHQQLFNGHLHQTYQSSLNNKSEWVSCLQGKAKIGLGLDKDRFILYWKIWSSQCTYLWSFNAYKFFCPTFPVWWNIASLSSS